MAHQHKKPGKRTSKPKRPCMALGCIHLAHTQGLCHSHLRQHLNGERLRPLRPYRTRVPKLVKMAGIKVTPRCARRIKKRAELNGLSLSAVVASVLERWDAESP